jgi:hypothetical protein
VPSGPRPPVESSGSTLCVIIPDGVGQLPGHETQTLSGESTSPTDVHRGPCRERWVLLSSPSAATVLNVSHPVTETLWVVTISCLAVPPAFKLI